jgi:hypothetical protein
MRKFIFESAIAPWGSQIPTVQPRLDLWKQAGMDSVFILMDDGAGASWPSALVKQNPAAHIPSEPVRRFVDLLHANGISAIFTFNLINYSPWHPIHPEWLITGTSSRYYNVWNEDFTTWRAQYIAECVNYCTPDAVAIDYCRSGRPAISEPVSASVAVKNALTKVKELVAQKIPTFAIVDSLHALPNNQGVDLIDWYDSGLISHALLFGYADPFPYANLNDIQASNSALPIWLCGGTYDISGGTVIHKPSRSVERIARSTIHKLHPSAYGLYLANIFNSEQANVMSNLHYMI